MSNQATSIPICTQEVDYSSSSEETSKDGSSEGIINSISDTHILTNEIIPSVSPTTNPSVMVTPKDNDLSLLPKNDRGKSTNTHSTTVLDEVPFKDPCSQPITAPDASITKNIDNVEDESLELDDLLSFLKTSKKENRNMTFRRDLIMAFQQSKHKIDPARFFVTDLKHHPIFQDLVMFFRKSITYRDSDWRAIEAGEILMKLWKLVLLQDKWKKDKDDQSKDSVPVRDLRYHILPCIARIKIDIESDARSKRKRTMYKDNSTSVQDNIVVKEHSKWFTRIEPHPCPKCHHNNIIPIIPIEDFVLQFSKKEYEQEQTKKQYEIDLYNATHTKDGKKRKNKLRIDEPKKPVFPKMMMACMCCVTKCRNIVDGRGCHHCYAVSKSKLNIPYNVKTAQCECELCKCNCNIVFAKASWQNIAADVEEALVLEEKDLKKSKSIQPIQEGK